MLDCGKSTVAICRRAPDLLAELVNPRVQSLRPLLQFTSVSTSQPRLVPASVFLPAQDLSFHDFDEDHNADSRPPPQRQQQASLPAIPRAPSSTASRSVRSLRRTPRLQESRSGSVRPNRPSARDQQNPAFRRSIPRPAPRPTQIEVDFGNSGSTTPQSFRKLVEHDSYWPQRSTHISRKTHEAILFALEAIRTGKGVDAKPLTEDKAEEEARMSDLLAESSSAGGPVSSRAQNASSRPAAGAGNRPMLTPTQVMAKRRDREARRAEQEATRRKQQEEVHEKQQEAVVGVGDNPTGERLTRPTEQPSAAPAPSVTATRRRSEQISTTNGAAPRAGVPAANQGQSGLASSQQPVGDVNYSGSVHKNRSEAFQKLSMPAVAGPRGPSQPQSTSFPQPTASAPVSTRAAFPHAFERWETLSSHWEGLTGYWIRRLQTNTDELSGKPIDQQMARQITDLSAAGANLFHAVVELQRLRASSERKFQRWFFETRNEQEQSQERVAELERLLRHERENPRTAPAASIEALQADKQKAEKLVGEMRRELQISKEEARRAWEELGRREQEERDRTIALRSGEPTSIGGVQVVPMAGPGLSSRQFSSVQRPQTRDGPIPGGPGPTSLGGQASQEVYSRSQTTLESPDQEQAQFTYRPGGTSPTGTDPFTEATSTHHSHSQLRHEPDTQFYSQQSQTQSRTSASTMPGRTVTSPTQSARNQIYGQPGVTSAIYQPLPITSTSQTPPRTGTAGTDRSEPRSYIPSVSGAGSEEEYHINPDGSYTRDAQGRRIPYRQPIGGSGELDEDDEADDNYSADVEREQMYAQQYSMRQQQGPARTAGQASAPPTSHAHHVSPEQTPAGFQGQHSPVSPQSYTSTASATSPPQPSGQFGDSGHDIHRQDQTSAAGWEGIPTTARHRHPTRLSDILEEQSSRTSPSRTSYISGDYPPISTSNGQHRR